MKYMVFLILVLLSNTANAQTYNPPVVTPPVIYGTPSISPSAGAGTGSTASIVGNNVAGTIVVTSGTETLSSSTLATITFGGTDTHTACNITPQNANAVGQDAMIFVTQPSAGTWTLGVAGSPVQSGFSYIWSYLCI